MHHGLSLKRTHRLTSTIRKEWFAWKRREIVETRVEVRLGGEVAGQPTLGWQFSAQLVLDKAESSLSPGFEPASPRATTLPLEIRSLHHCLYHRLRIESSENRKMQRSAGALRRYTKWGLATSDTSRG
jgi:hypothetical protein